MDKRFKTFYTNNHDFIMVALLLALVFIALHLQLPDYVALVASSILLRSRS